MTKIYRHLPDHKCDGAREMSQDEILYFESYACWCSPNERHWKFDWNGETYEVEHCPACGELMNPGWNKILSVSQSDSPITGIAFYAPLTKRQVFEKMMTLYGERGLCNTKVEKDFCEVYAHKEANDYVKLEKLLRKTDPL